MTLSSLSFPAEHTSGKGPRALLLWGDLKSLLTHHAFGESVTNPGFILIKHVSWPLSPGTSYTIIAETCFAGATFRESPWVAYFLPRDILEHVSLVFASFLVPTRCSLSVVFTVAQS